MPFSVQSVLQTKCNERQKRELHEQAYMKYVSNLRRQSFDNKNMFHLSIEHIREVERAGVRNLCSRNIQYERIKRQNAVLSERFFKPNQQAIVDHRNQSYEQNLNIFNLKHLQQRLHEYNRINEENQILMKRFQNTCTRLVSKEQCEQEWQRHIDTMKKSSDYPEHIDAFVSNNRKHQYNKACPWNRRFIKSRPMTQSTEDSFTLLV